MPLSRFARTATVDPKHRAAMDALRRLAEEMAGRKLPGERELAERLSISRQRLRSLLDHLEVEGVVVRRQGSGTYAAEVRDEGLEHVGLLIDRRLKIGDDPFFSILTERLQIGLQSAGVHCFVERIDGTQRPRYLGDGAITVGLAGSRILKHLLPADPPVVGLLDEPLAGPAPQPDRMSLLMVEDQFAGRAAARRAVDEGARRLVFLGRDDIAASVSRCRGAREAAEQAGAGFDFLACGMNYGAGRAAGLTLASSISDTDLTTALIAANDWLAVGLRAGLSDTASVLRDAPIYSFDGLPIASDPALAIRSLTYPMATIADDAVAELRRLVRHRKGRVIRYPMEWADGWRDTDDGTA